jgi:hypothetical protein
MNSTPDLHYHLPSRSAGSFGTSPPGRFAEALTLTWLRFEAFLIWLVLLAALIAAPSGSAVSKLVLLAVSPAAAFAVWVLLKLTGWVFYFVPGLGRLWGWGRIIFLWTFSRLVVQAAPTIDMPAWGAR